jgi:hypothetical protein
MPSRVQLGPTRREKIVIFPKTNELRLSRVRMPTPITLTASYQIQGLSPAAMSAGEPFLPRISKRHSKHSIIPTKKFYIHAESKRTSTHKETVGAVLELEWVTFEGQTLSHLNCGISAMAIFHCVICSNAIFDHFRKS